VGTCDIGALTAVVQHVIGDDGQAPGAQKFSLMMALGLGLIFLGQQSRCEVALELIGTIADFSWASFVQATVSSCAYAGTGNVIEIQKNLRICTGGDGVEHAAAVVGIAVIAIGDPVGCHMARRMFEHVMQYGKPYARRMVPIAIALTSVSNPHPELIDMLHRIAHDTDVNVANNAAIGIGLLAAGTQNPRAVDALRRLASFHKGNPATVMFLQVAEGLTHLGQGLMTLSPTYGDSTLLHPVGLGALMTVAYGCIQADDLLTRMDPLLLFFVAPAIGPRFLVTLDENLEFVPVQVRVGGAIDVVGQAGRPRAITGFQTLDTPVILAAGQRAEFVDDTYEPLSPILEGFVIVKKRPPRGSESA
jgi:26S proteasome regulatory subunit N1